MSDESILEAVDTETLIEAVDISDLIEEIDLAELAEREDVADATRSLAATVGREFGAALGRELGAIAARAITERPSIEDPIERVKLAISDAIEELFTDSDVRASLTNEVRAIAKAQLSDESTDADSEDSGDEGGETNAEVDEDGESKEIETEEDLSELSYRELQSLAKEQDVKANLSREEMTEQLSEALDLDE